MYNLYELLHKLRGEGLGAKDEETTLDVMIQKDYCAIVDMEDLGECVLFVASHASASSMASHHTSSTCFHTGEDACRNILLDSLPAKMVSDDMVDTGTAYFHCVLRG